MGNKSKNIKSTMREAGDIQCKDVTYLEDSRNMTKFILEINR